MLVLMSNLKLLMNHAKLECLEIFWNPIRKNVRNGLTDFLAAYIEVGDFTDPLFQLSKNNFSMVMEGLRLEGLVAVDVKDGVQIWSLTKAGHLALHRRHPSFKIGLQNLIESTPELVIVVAGIIGFIASIAGIVQFGDWFIKYIHGRV